MANMTPDYGLKDLINDRTIERRERGPTIIHHTEDYKLVAEPLEWEGTSKGSIGYRVYNKVTGVVEGEGSILASALAYVDNLQTALDRYREPPMNLGGGGEDLN